MSKSLLLKALLLYLLCTTGHYATATPCSGPAAECGHDAAENGDSLLPAHPDVFSLCIKMRRAIERLNGNLTLVQLLRQNLQRHQLQERIWLDYDLLVNHKREPSNDEDTKRAFHSPLSLQKLEQLRDQADHARHRLWNTIQHDTQKLHQSLAPSSLHLNLTHLHTCLSARLDTRLYADPKPTVSFLLQYYKRPWMLPKIVGPLQRCHKPSQGMGLEVVVNADHPQDSALLAELVANTSGFVVPVFSHNLHEIRAYNRLARLARGNIMVMLQDDDVLPDHCEWIHRMVRAFQSWPRLGAIGFQRYQYDYHPNSTNEYIHFRDAKHDLPMQFVSIVDYAPIAVRRAAYEVVGGIDENFSGAGMCGVHSDYDMAMRMWLAGWQVAFMEIPNMYHDEVEGEGGTHRPGVAGLCWVRQWQMAIHYMDTRWGRGRWGDGYYYAGSPISEMVSEHVRRLNLRELERTTDFCPFGDGCELPPGEKLYQAQSQGVVAPARRMLHRALDWLHDEFGVPT